MYWLVDDGGLTVLLPHLLVQHARWSKCKLHLLSLPSSNDSSLQAEQARLLKLMSQFRIDADVSIVSDVTTKPSQESVAAFNELVDSVPTTAKQRALRVSDSVRKKSLQFIRLGEIIRRESADARFVFVSMPVPAADVPDVIFMAWLEQLTAGLQGVALVRGAHTNVLTIHS